MNARRGDPADIAPPSDRQMFQVAVPYLDRTTPARTTRQNRPRSRRGMGDEFKSVTISSASEAFGNCSGGFSSGSTLGYPDGSCSTPAYTVTNNGSVPEGLDVTGRNAVASDGGTGWNLIGSTGTPGQDQYQLHTNFGLYLSTNAQWGLSPGQPPTTGPERGTEKSKSKLTQLERVARKPWKISTSNGEGDSRPEGRSRFTLQVLGVVSDEP